jgi:hypothetical protein
MTSFGSQVYVSIFKVSDTLIPQHPGTIKLTSSSEHHSQRHWSHVRLLGTSVQSLAGEDVR